MSQPSDFEARLTADLGVKVDANRSAINTLGEQTAARFTRLEQQITRLERQVDTGFGEMRSKLDQTAAGQHQIGELLRTLIGEQGDESSRRLDHG